MRSRKPNMQSITPKTAEGEQIRKALGERFPLSQTDFSQIEQRALAHIGVHMKTYAVAFANMSDNMLKIELIQADSWVEAAKAHSGTLFQDPDQDENLTTVEEAKQYAFDCDGYFDIILLSVNYDTRVIEQIQISDGSLD